MKSTFFLFSYTTAFAHNVVRSLESKYNQNLVYKLNILNVTPVKYLPPVGISYIILAGMALCTVCWSYLAWDV